MGKRGPKPKRSSVVWSSNLAYAVGLMVTDGNVSKDGRHINLTSKDTEQLNNFMRCINSSIRISQKVSGYTEEPISYIQFSDATLHRFFTSIGIMPDKINKLGVVDVPDDLFGHFLRGHLDGDGYFHAYIDRRWNDTSAFSLAFVSACTSHINWLQDTISRLYGARGAKSLSRANRVSELRFAKTETMRLLQQIYPNRDVIALSRKRLKIERALRIVGQSLFV